MRKFILMTSAVVLFPLSSIAQTTCTASPSCTTLGYTESSCPDGNGVKCPWGNKWFCGASCSQLGFTYSCSGTGYSGGKGPACNGKYQSCTCASGLTWSNGSCVEICAIGSILFSDFTCDNNVVSGKTPIGVVVYKDGKGGGQAMALKSIGNYVWASDEEDVSDLPNLSKSEATTDYASCENSKKIMAQGNSSTFPAVWAANNYATAGTKAGDWCLPAAGIFTIYYNNKDSLNAAMQKAGGDTLTYAAVNTPWSSTENSYRSAFYLNLGYSDGLFASHSKTGSFSLEVRPVIEF